MDNIAYYDERVRKEIAFQLKKIADNLEEINHTLKKVYEQVY